MEIPPLESYREGIESALRKCGQDVTFDEIAKSVDEGFTVMWAITTRSVILTQISGRTLNFFIASGIAHELRQAMPAIEAYGRDMGCTTASMLGRKGWAKSWLGGDGWEVSPLVLMAKSL